MVLEFYDCRMPRKLKVFKKWLGIVAFDTDYAACFARIGEAKIIHCRTRQSVSFRLVVTEWIDAVAAIRSERAKHCIVQY